MENSLGSAHSGLLLYECTELLDSTISPASRVKFAIDAFDRSVDHCLLLKSLQRLWTKHPEKSKVFVTSRGSMHATLFPQEFGI